MLFKKQPRTQALETDGWKSGHIWRNLAWFVIALSLVAELYVAFGPFRSYPFSMDEYSYWYQAKIFAQGRLAIDIPKAQSVLHETYMVWDHGRLFSKYTPGFSMYLTPFATFGLAAAGNPVISAVSHLILYALVASLIAPMWGFVAVLLMASSPYFVGYSASFFAQPLSLCLGLLVFYWFRRSELTSKRRYEFALGATLGFMIWVRPLDAVCSGVAIAAPLLSDIYKDLCKNADRSRDFADRLLRVGGVCLFFLAGLIFFNYLLIGGFHLTVYPEEITRSEFQIFPLPGAGIFRNLFQAAHNYKERFFSDTLFLLKNFFIPYCLPFIPLLAVLGLKWKARWPWMFLIHFSALVLLYNFHNPFHFYSPGPGWPQYGARYIYPGFSSLVILSLFGLKRIRDYSEASGDVIVAILVVIIVALQSDSAREKIFEYRERFDIAFEIQQDIDNKCPGRRIVGISASRSAVSTLPPFLWIYDLCRNPFMDGEKLFVRGTVSSSVAALFPDRPPCNYIFEGVKD